jgi:hypothetical protein
MIDKWFLNDISEVLEHHHRLVITDALGDGEFLLEYLPPKVTRINVEYNDLAEIEARYLAEKEHRDDNVVFYTKQPKEKLKFLLEYAETNGCVVLDDMERYIKTHLFDAIHENTQLQKVELLTAAKVSRGKDLNWWKSVSNRTINPLDVTGFIMDLLHNPDETRQMTDADIWKTCAAEVYQLIGKPQTEQPAETMAQNIMDTIFTGLLNNQLPDSLLSIYYSCTDSTSMKEQMAHYIGAFHLPADASPLKAHPDHCFAELDKRLFRMLSDTLKEGGFKEQYQQYVTLRMSSKKAMDYKALWLKDVKTLLEFRHSKLNAVMDMNAFINYYRDVFAPLDSAIRHLYAEWLHEEVVMRPYQELYEQYNKELLGKWFTFTGDYMPTQKNVILNAFADAGRTAVVVCDGLRLEITETVAKKVNGQLNKTTAFAMLPSVTENGMSALFGCDGVEVNAVKRYQHLQEMLPDVQVMQLEKLNSGITANHLVLLFGDIDQVGEKKQMAALKDINAYEELLTKWIQEIFQMGYQKVILTTDHGFVITGILDEADKMPVPNGADKVEERFSMATERLSVHDMIERKFDFTGSTWQYYSKTDKPFKTRGCYGYAHGGMTPQECIIPVYEFTQQQTAEALHISITNKQMLKEVTGNYFTVKLKAAGDNNSLFLQERRIIVQVYHHDKIADATPVFKMTANSLQEYEYEMPASDDVKVVVIDAQTKEQIDFCSVERNDARGLDGLL